MIGTGGVLGEKWGFLPLSREHLWRQAGLMEHMAVRRRVVTVTVSSLLLCGSLFSQRTVPIQDPSDPQRARLSGTVLNERAQPVPEITVTAMPPVAIGAKLPRTQTDANGRFALAGLIPGHTYVQAFDEKAFYPDAASNFWDGQGVAEIELASGREVSGVLLTLKPAGRLEVKARDADSGAEIDQIVVRVERDGEPNRWISGSKMGDWWLVPTAAVRLCVQAKGFMAVWYGWNGSYARSTPITLAPRQIFVATVSLVSLPAGAAEATCFDKEGR